MAIWFGIIPMDGNTLNSPQEEHCYMSRDSFWITSSTLRQLGFEREANILQNATTNKTVRSDLQIIPVEKVLEILAFVDECLEVIENSDLKGDAKMEPKSTLITFRDLGRLSIRVGRPLAIYF